MQRILRLLRSQTLLLLLVIASAPHAVRAVSRSAAAAAAPAQISPAGSSPYPYNTAQQPSGLPSLINWESVAPGDMNAEVFDAMVPYLPLPSFALDGLRVGVAGMAPPLATLLLGSLVSQPPSAGGVSLEGGYWINVSGSVQVLADTSTVANIDGGVPSVSAAGNLTFLDAIVRFEVTPGANPGLQQVPGNTSGQLPPARIYGSGVDALPGVPSPFSVVLQASACSAIPGVPYNLLGSGPNGSPLPSLADVPPSQLVQASLFRLPTSEDTPAVRFFIGRGA